jgi:hypothetical protein
MTELYVWWHESHPDVSLESITSSIVGPHMGRPAALTVSGVATQFGVWEYGHLANDYQLLFGELPSETFRDVRSAQIITNARCAMICARRR